MVFTERLNSSAVQSPANSLQIRLSGFLSMTNTNAYLKQVEDDLRKMREVGKGTCEAFAGLAVESQAAYARAMAFVGCERANASPDQPHRADEADRVRAVRLMLLKLGLDSSDPRWSSWLLDRLLEVLMGAPGGGVGDLLHALHELLGEQPRDLTEPMRNIIKDLVVQCFTQHRASYDAADLRWMVEKTMEGPTPAQAYLALHAIPPSITQPRCAMAILKALASTPYWTEAVNTLEEDLNNQEGRALLREWLAEGTDASCAKDVERLLS